MNGEVETYTHNFNIIMKTQKTAIALLLITTCLLREAFGHGRLLEPPSRSSMWRFGYDSPKNYDDNQLSCGGVGIQYSPEVNGKCGVCGDPWNGPRQNEPGGKYANGIVVRKYEKGQIINVSIELTANHKGFFEFRLCPTDDPFHRVKQKCLDKHVLTDAFTGDTRYRVLDKGYKKRFRIKIRLPDDVVCRACLLQWKYNAGNSWGKGKDGEQCIGCGNQEQFYGCADIAIGYDDVVIGKPTRKNPWVNKDGFSNWDFGHHGNLNVTKCSGGNTLILIVTGSYPVYICFSILLYITMIHHRLLS